jgi:hypothetical protein
VAVVLQRVRLRRAVLPRVVDLRLAAAPRELADLAAVAVVAVVAAV